MAVSLSYHDLEKLGACEDRRNAVAELLGGATAWGDNQITADQARAAGATFDDIVWAASSIARNTPDVERRLRLWLADCAARVLHIYERVGNSQAPRNAILAARQFARGEIDVIARAAWAAAGAAAGDAAGDAWAAWAAAGAAAGDAAGDAWDAWDAARAAGAAAGDAWDAWDAARAAGAAARAAAGDAAGDAWDAARDAEQAWQFDRLIARLSDDEPEDWPLPAAPIKEAAE